MFPVDSLQPSQFLCQLCDSTMSACLLKRHFSNRFLHCINFTIHFLHQQQIFTHCKMLLCNFFFSSNLTQWFQVLAKGFLMFICMLYYFPYPNQRCRTLMIAVFQVLYLERLQSQTHFLRYETKLSQFFFYCSQNYILLSNYIRDSVYLRTVSSCSFVLPLPLIELRSIFPLKDT